jgi:hypothetical protein
MGRWSRRAVESEVDQTPEIGDVHLVRALKELDDLLRPVDTKPRQLFARHPSAQEQSYQAGLVDRYHALAMEAVDEGNAANADQVARIALANEMAELYRLEEQLTPGSNGITE